MRAASSDVAMCHVKGSQRYDLPVRFRLSARRMVAILSCIAIRDIAHEVALIHIHRRGAWGSVVKALRY